VIILDAHIAISLKQINSASLIMIAILPEMEKNPAPVSKRVHVPKMLVLKSTFTHDYINTWILS